KNKEFASFTRFIIFHLLVDYNRFVSCRLCLNSTDPKYSYSMSASLFSFEHTLIKAKHHFPDWSISFSTPLASKKRIYALYDMPLFRDSIFSFFKTRGSNFNVTGV